MRVYIINADDLIVSREPPATPGENEIVVASLVERLWSALEAMPDPQPVRVSKQAEVIALLRRAEGATVDEVRAITGWQPHTVRGMFSGALKNKLGLAVIPTKEER